MGVGLQDLTADLRDELQLPSDVKGVVVTMSSQEARQTMPASRAVT